MYKVKTVCSKDFLVESNIDNKTYFMDLNREEGTTPMGVLNVALSGCVIMCVRGYFLKKKIKDVEINLENTYENEKFIINISLNREVNEIEKKEIFAYIKEKCTVSKMLKESIIIEFNIV